MNDKLVYSFTEYLRLQFTYNDDEIAKIKYSLEVFLYEFEKLIVLLLIFSFLGKTDEFVISTIVLFTIRPFAGGLHFDKFMNCFLFTFLFYLLAIVILPLIQLNQFTATIILCVSALSNSIFAPVSSKYRPEKSKKTDNKFRILSTIIILIHSLNILFIFDNHLILSCYIWTIALQNIQLFISKEMVKNEI